jgi:hypothetical protein
MQSTGTCGGCRMVSCKGWLFPHSFCIWKVFALGVHPQGLISVTPQG